jgi:hypothetical protein
MKNASGMILAAALAAFSGLANAEDSAALRSVVERDAPHCANVTVSAPVKFRNRTLVEIPDIQEPELRLANQLLSAGCYARAVNQLETVTRRDPDNAHAQYITARMAWMTMDASIAEQVINRALARHPDFTSGKVLLAGIRFEQEKLAESLALLNEAEARSPTDLWIHLDKMRVEVFKSPSADLRARLFEIIRNPAFPPNAREGAADAAKHLPQGRKEYEEILWARLEIESNIGTACKTAELAFWLSEIDGRFADVIKLLESPRAQKGNCLGLLDNRVLLAQAYLMEAAKINAGPSAANAQLVKRADQLLGGDFTSLKTHAMERPQYARLKPFLDARVKVDTVDRYGYTALCNGVMALDPVHVREELEAGANPNQKCANSTLVRYMMLIATNEKDEERREIMGLLLQHGAPLTKAELEACGKSDEGDDCHEVMYPMMLEYAARAR